MMTMIFLLSISILQWLSENETSLCHHKLCLLPPVKLYVAVVSVIQVVAYPPPPPVGDFMHELSNDGARAQFDKLINRVLLPVMVDCAKVGGTEGQWVGGAIEEWVGEADRVGRWGICVCTSMCH